MKGYSMIAVAALLASACAAEHEAKVDPRQVAATAGEFVMFAQVERPSFMNVSGTAEPLRQATLSTRLMGAVLQVDFQAGDIVRRGQALLRIDARDLEAKSAQLEAALAEAQAVHAEAELNVRRMRALFADEAAPRAQLDASETGLTRAAAGVSAVRANAMELAAMRDYSVVRAPFDGVVVARMVDPGSFAAPGSPLLVLQDDAELRISASTTPEAARGLTRGQQVNATIEGVPASGHVEGVVPAPGGSLYIVNVIVPNPLHTLPARGSATLALPLGYRSTFVVPQRAIVRQGDMTGVHLRRGSESLLRWVRTVPAAGDSVEIVAGLRDGDVLIVPVGG
jgi:RND family efflux transporter MFP subunit